MTSWRKTRQQVLARDVVCQDCGVALEGRWECAHRLPRYQGGDDSLENTRALCVACHRLESNAEAGHRAAGKRTTVKTHLGQVVKPKRPKSWRPIPGRRKIDKPIDPWNKKFRERIKNGVV